MCVGFSSARSVHFSAAHGATEIASSLGMEHGDPGPVEISNYNAPPFPIPGQLHDTRVEPICRKYLNAHRLLPYLYSAVHECRHQHADHASLWLHFPDDRKLSSVATSICGQDVLVAPVIEKEATTRRVCIFHAVPG